MLWISVIEILNSEKASPMTFARKLPVCSAFLSPGESQTTWTSDTPPNPEDEGLPGLARLGMHTSNIKRPFSALKNRDLRLKQGPEYVSIDPRTVQIHKNPVRSEKFPEHVPAHDGHYTVSLQMSAVNDIPRRRRHLVKGLGKNNRTIYKLYCNQSQEPL